MTTSKKFITVLKFGLICFVVAITMSSCTGWVYQGLVEKGYAVSAYFKNNDSQEVHLYRQGESNGPDNKVQPGKSRNVSYHFDEAVYTFTAVAFRNGAVISTKTYDVEYTVNDNETERYCSLTINYPW